MPIYITNNHASGLKCLGILVVLAMAWPAAAQPAPGQVTYSAGQGAQFSSADGQDALGLSARIALRETATLVEDNLRTETQVKTVRLWLRGRQGGSEQEAPLTWLIQLAVGGRDHEADSPTPLFDAWVRWRAHRDVQVQVGQWFVPFDRARTVREFALQLVDRPLAVRELTLDRDAGLAVMSDDLLGLGGKVLYRLGVFGGEGRNRFAPAGYPKGPLAVGRVELRPFGPFDADVEGDAERLPSLRLAVGLAAAQGWSSLRVRGTTGGDFAGGATVDYRWWVADLTAKWRGLSLLAEVVERQQVGASAAVGRASGIGAVVQGGAMLSEHLELAGRWTRLWPRGSADQTAVQSPLQAQAGHELGAGLNWYLLGHKRKLQLDAQQSWNTSDGTALGGKDGKLLVRLAVDMTF